jgi:hypothetical protein
MRYFNVMILGPTQSPYEGSQIVLISQRCSSLLLPFSSLMHAAQRFIVIVSAASSDSALSLYLFIQTDMFV